MDAAIPRGAVVLTALATFGAGNRRVIGSPPCSASVFRCLNAGSGTRGVSESFGSIGMERGNVQPEGLCLVGSGIALRAFAAASCNSLRARGGDVIPEKVVEGGFMPERFAMLYNGPRVRLAPGHG